MKPFAFRPPSPSIATVLFLVMTVSVPLVYFVKPAKRPK